MADLNLQATSARELDPVKSQLQAVRERLRRHKLYGMIQSPEDLRVFVEHHIICVFDFMSLLKSLQRDLSCVAVPWTPVQDAKSARLIQQIAIDEEADPKANGKTQSHFEWYLEGMEEIGADTIPIRRLVKELANGASWESALSESALPKASQEFGATTAAFLDHDLPLRAAVFFHGREEIIPEMFLPIVDNLGDEGLPCSAFRAYLKRHIELDSDEHGPAGLRLLSRLYKSHPNSEPRAERAALEALLSREGLWDAIARKLGE